jgi:hypothetical protein
MDQLVELRNYVLAPGAAPAFVEHFERHFLASQEELGMDIVGQFTVPGDDGRFVWIRRFSSPAERGAALSAFYTGPVWKEFGPRANELMADHTDVHLLVPEAPSFAADHVPHALRSGAAGLAGSTVVAAVFELGGGSLGPAIGATADADAGTEGGAGLRELGRLVTAGVANDFPRLPVHEGAAVGVWLLADEVGGRAATALAETVADRRGLGVDILRLAPTRHSTLR